MIVTRDGRTVMVLPCTNDDESCGKDVFHDFPIEGQQVTFVCDSARIIGSSREFDTSRLTGTVTSHIIAEAHQVGVRIEGNNYDVTVWVDVTEDIEETKES